MIPDFVVFNTIYFERHNSALLLDNSFVSSMGIWLHVYVSES